MALKKRSKISLSHYKLLSMKMGYIVPIGLTEVLPGDTFQVSTSSFIRVSPLVSPVMHPVHVKIHHWYVPFRLIWDDFEDFITGGEDGLNTSVVPYMTLTDAVSIGSLADYLGVPTGQAGLKLCALPFRAYNLIYNEWYRDQDLEDEVAISTESGEDTTTATQLMQNSWARDYFTTARPWPQKGPAVSVPVNLTAAGEPTITASVRPTGVPTFVGSQSSPSSLYAKGSEPNQGFIYIDNPAKFGSGAINWSNPNLAVDIDFKSGNPELGSVDINQLREAFALQRFEEHRALYGSRYTEYLRYLGIRASDARLQRPEYLGGGKQTIQFSEVLQTAEGTDPVGTLRGHGIAAMRTNRFRRFFEENGYLLTFMTVQPIAVYMQGLPRLWQREVKEDFFQKELQHIGQQEVYKSELYATAANTTTKATFGYQNRYDEYRYHESSVSGEFRTMLNYWHMARDFSAEPELNASFLNGLPTNRIYASTNTDQLYVMANHSIQARRLMAKLGNPI